MVEIVRKHIKQFSFQTFRDKETILICCIYLPKLFRKKFQKPFEFQKFAKKTFDIRFFFHIFGPFGPKNVLLLFPPFPLLKRQGGTCPPSPRLVDATELRACILLSLSKVVITSPTIPLNGLSSYFQGMFLKTPSCAYSIIFPICLTICL